MRHTIIRFLVFCLCLYAGSGQAFAETSPWVEREHSAARLISSVGAVGDLSEIRLGVQVRLDPHWHTYWRMPGDTGLPPEMDWGKSTNMKSVSMGWPAPKRFEAFGFENYGYDNEVIFPITFVPETPREATLIDLDMVLLVCEEICIPESFQLSLSLPSGEALPTPFAERIESAFDSIPKTAMSDALALQNVWVKGLSITAEIISSGTFDAPPDVFFETPDLLTFGAPEQEFLDNNKTVRVTMELTSPPPGTTSLHDYVTRNGMTATIVNHQTGHAIETPVVIGAEPLTPIKTATDSTSETGQTLLLMLGFALLGGLILNLMPCVLPVLSLKLLSVVSHGGSVAGKVRAGFLASAAGIIFSFLVIAVSLISLKSAGASIGWGIQFQQPVFLVFLIILLILFALNLWGVFEIRLPRFLSSSRPASHDHEPTLTGHFMTGAFATLLATPCTAPFLGTAVGFALSRTASDILIIFAALGIGMALPYLMVAAFPAMARILPKPGHWMITLKKILALALLGTAIWLGFVLMALRGPAPDSTATFWAPFNESQIAEYVAKGNVVFVDVTADWCLTCKANKKFVLDTDIISEALQQDHVIAMRADWTKPSETIAAYLKKHGRFGIPFNAVYGPSIPNGKPLSELLTKDEVLNALDQAK